MKFFVQATYNTDRKRRWYRMNSPWYVFEAKDCYDAERYVKRCLPKTARDVKFDFKEITQ